MVTAKQRAWRKKFAARYGKKKKTRRARRARVVKQKRRPRPMARRRRGRKGGRKSKAIPVALAVPAVYVGYKRVYEPIKAGNWDQLKQMWTGIADDGTFTQQSLVKTYGPLLVGAIVHKAAGRMGVNKYLSKATMGYLVI